MAYDGAPATDDEVACLDIARFDRLKGDRSNFEQTWNQQRRVFFPGSLDFTAQNDVQGQRDRQVAVDGFGIITVEELADFIVNSLANVAVRSFGLRLAEGYGQPTLEEARWLETVMEIQHAALHDPRSQYTEALFAVAREFGGYDNGALYVGDRPGGLPLFLQVPLAQSVWSLDGDNELLTFDWRKRYTAEQAVLKFKDNTPAELKEKAKLPSAATTYYDFQHVMVRNPEVIEGSGEVRARPWLTRWVCCDYKRVVGQSYLAEPCYFVFQRPRQGEDIYGRGPASNALEDANMSQRVRVSGIRGMEKAVDPLTVLPDDGVLSAPTYESRGVMIVRSELMRGQNEPIRQYAPSGKPEMAMEFGENLHLTIARHFKTDKLSLPREPRMPMGQIVGLEKERMAALAPTLMWFQRPLAQVQVRVFNILKRAGKFNAAGNGMVMEGRKLAIAYESPMLRQLALAEAEAGIHWMEIVGAGAKLDEKVAMLPRMVELVRGIGLALGVPPTWMNTDDEIAAQKEGQQEVLEEQQQAEQAKDASTVVKNAAPMVQALGGVAANQQEAA